MSRLITTSGVVLLILLLCVLSAKWTTTLAGLFVIVLLGQISKLGSILRLGSLVLFAVCFTIPFDVRVVSSDSAGFSIMNVTYTAMSAKQRIVGGETLDRDFILTREPMRFFAPKTILAVKLKRLQPEEIASRNQEIAGR